MKTINFPTKAGVKTTRLTHVFSYHFAIYFPAKRTFITKDGTVFQSVAFPWYIETINQLINWHSGNFTHHEELPISRR